MLSESSADEAAVRLLVEAILGQPTELVLPEGLRTRGWPGVLNILPNVLRHLHYRTDTEGLVVVVDSDKSPLHREDASPESETCDCRLCKVRRAAMRTQAELQSRHLKTVIKFAAGLAVPSIEAWFRCGIDPHVTEAAWMQSLQSNSFPFTTRSLKRDVYGSDSPGLPLQTERAIEAARRLSQQPDLLKTFFPSGFGSLINDLSRW